MIPKYWFNKNKTTHGHVECVSRVLLHGSQSELQTAGVTRMDHHGIFLYFDLALSSHRDCGFCRASARIVRSLLEHLKLTQWSVDDLVVPYVQEDHQSTSCSSALFHACGHLKKVCSSPLCASGVQCIQEFYIPDQYIRDLNCCAAKSASLPHEPNTLFLPPLHPPRSTDPTNLQTLCGDYLGLGLIR